MHAQFPMELTGMRPGVCVLWSCVDIETSTESRRGRRDPPTHGSCGRSQMFIKHKVNQVLPLQHTSDTEADKQKGEKTQWRKISFFYKEF